MTFEEINANEAKKISGLIQVSNSVKTRKSKSHEFHQQHLVDNVNYEGGNISSSFESISTLSRKSNKHKR